MNFSRRSVLAGLAGSAAGSLSAPKISRAQAGKELRYLTRFDPNILDPHFNSSSGTRNEGYLVFDTLYGVDDQQNPHPQMLAGHTVEDNELRWILTLRDGLQWHDGEKVLAKDCVASIKRWAVRDGIGQSLLAATDEIAALDDTRIQIRLKTRYPFLPYSLGKPGGASPMMMPQRIAEAFPNKPTTELIGSGPFKFRRDEYVPGSSLAFEKFKSYLPLSSGIPSGTAGPKHVHFDRVTWRIIPDLSTAISTLASGGADWIELLPPELTPLVAKNKQIKLRILDPFGFCGVMRPNHLQPPFNNPGVRRAILGAIDQDELMTALVGDSENLKQVPCGFFAPGLPMASEEGMDVLKGKRDYAKVNRDLVAAGYKGETAVILNPVDLPGYIPLMETLSYQLQKGGLKVDLQNVDWSTVMKRRISKEPTEKGGWSAFVTLGFYSSEILDPFTNVAIRANGTDAWVGWPTSGKLEDIRTAWMNASSDTDRKKLAADIQKQAFVDVPYIPLGVLKNYTAYDNRLQGILDGFPKFWNVKLA